MKKFFTSIAAGAVLALLAAVVFQLISPAPAHAQGFGSVVPTYGTAASLNLSGIGTTAGGATTTVTNGYIDCRSFQNVTLQTVFTFADATTTNVVYTIDRSIDKVNWETVDPLVWTVAGNGTNTVVAHTNIFVGGCGWLRLKSIQNTDGSVVLTNTAFKYSIKRSAP